MLKQRTINLNPDEILIVKSGSDPREMLEARILFDNLDEPHVFVAARPFAAFHSNKTPDEVERFLTLATSENEYSAFERNR